MSIWPIAPLWYVLFVLFVVILFYFVKNYQKRQIKRQAIKLLKKYQHQYMESNPAIAAQKVSEILKRVALCYFPQEKVAGLNGEDWVKFLDNTSNNKLKFNEIKNFLTELPYSQKVQYDVKPLFQKSFKWIKKVKVRHV